MTSNKSEFSLICNYHVVKGATKVRLLTGAGLIDATAVKVDGTGSAHEAWR